MTADKDEYQRRFRAIQAGFLAELEPKQRQIEQDWRALQEDWGAPPLESLYITVHRLAGAGETFGFPQLSERARRLDRLLAACHDQERPAEGDLKALEEALQALTSMIESLKPRV